jgi:hypothetical protein
VFKILQLGFIVKTYFLFYDIDLVIAGLKKIFIYGQWIKGESRAALTQFHNEDKKLGGMS